TVLAAVFVGVAAGVTSLATKSRILVDLKLLDTRVAHVLMAGALIADTISLIIFAAVIGVAEAGALDVGALALLSVQALGFFAVAAVIGLKVLPWLGPRLLARKDLGRTSQFMLVLIVGLGFAELAELVGMHGILGAFLGGLFLREPVLGRTGAKEMMHLVRDASLGFLAPVFFVTAGFAVSLDVFSTNLGLLLGIVGLATVGKIVGTMLFYLPTGHGWREGLTIGAGMNGRGAVEIIVAQIGLSLGLITQEIFSILVFMAIATTATVPLFLKWGVAWLRRRGELVRSEEQRQGALILGAGPTARALGRILSRSIPVRLMDRNAARAEAAEADGLAVLRGNALDEEMLAEAGAAHVRHFIALTENAEVNALAARIARDAFRVPEIHVVHHGAAEGHQALLEHVAGSTLFAGPVALADWDYRIGHDQAERHGLPVGHHTDPLRFFAQLRRDRTALPLALRRGDAYLPFHGGLELRPDDRAVVLTLPDVPRASIFDRFDHLAAHAPVIDVDGPLEADAFFGLAAEALAPRLEAEPSALAAAFADREATASTVLLPGLAVPHVLVEGTGRFAMLVARCREGIRFPGQAEHVHTVFVLAGSMDERTFHLRALAAIAKIVQWPDFERNWMEAVDAEALRQLVLRSVRRRLPEARPGDETPPVPLPA
ncbi:MAG: cation:proton antiporter, partial [Rhodothermales bacterium]|nr:cation:proton antiporter [Rhodothermales bacterium]